MDTTYKSVSGKTYSSNDVEKVGGSYYVKGTSINVSPVSSSSGSSGSTTSKSVSSSVSSSTSNKSTSSGSSRSSGGSSSNNKIDTTGLSGYALEFANAWNQGMNYDQASQYAAQRTSSTSSKSSSSSSPSYASHLSWFGSPQAYAAEIMRKEAAGIPLDDPQAAAAFKRDYPQLFSATPQQTYQQPYQTYQQPYQTYQQPYQQQMEQLYAQRPQYTPRSWEQLLEQARSYANLVIDPQVSAIQRSLEQYRQSAEANKQAVEAAYASVPERTSRLMEEARRNAITSAISRGAGQSGAVEWLTSKLQEPLLEQQHQLEAERVAKLAEISSNLALAEKQAGEKLQELEKLRGQYAEQQAKALEELDYARAAGDWERAFEALNKMTSNAASYQNMANQMVTALMPYLRMTVAQEAAAKNDLVNTLGQTMGPINLNQSNVVPVRQYITSNYGAQYIDYDPATDSVIINGKKIPISLLWSYGGYFDEGANRAYLPTSVIEDILWGRL